MQGLTAHARTGRGRLGEFARYFPLIVLPNILDSAIPKSEELLS